PLRTEAPFGTYVPKHILASTTGGEMNLTRHIDSTKLRCKSLAHWTLRSAARTIGQTLPLSLRKVLLTSRLWQISGGKFDFAIGMLDDLRRRDPDALHRFLWSNHLGYAASYEVPCRFGATRLNPSRRILFSDMVDHLRSRGIDPRLDVRSIFEVGCS